MDPYTLGIIIRSVLQSSGLKGLVVVILLGGIIFSVWKTVRFIANFAEKLLSQRDSMLSQTLQRVAEQDRQRAAYEVEMARVLQSINGTISATHLEARDTRKEMHERFGGMQEQHLAMEKQLSRIEGGMP